VVAIVAAVFLAVSGGFSLGPSGGPATKHYSGGGVSFDYPENWGVGNSTSPNAVVALIFPQENTLLVVTKDPMPSGATLKACHDQTVIAMSPNPVLSERSLTVAGAAAQETIFRSETILPPAATVATVRLVSIEKDGSLYNIFCAAPPAEFDKAQIGFDIAINSFTVPSGLTTTTPLTTTTSSSFEISVSPSTLTIPRGGSGNLTINFQGTPVQGGMPGQTVPSHLGYEVVEIEGFPPTGRVQYSGAPGSSTTFVLTFTVAEDAAVGSYSTTVVCTDMDRDLSSLDNFTLVLV